MVTSLYSAIYGTEAVIGVIIWSARFNPAFSSWIEENTGIEDRWLWVPLGLLVAHLFFKAMHEKNEKWSRDLIEECSQSNRSGNSIDEKMRRLEEVRSLLKSQSDRAPENGVYDPYTHAKGLAWLQEVEAMLEQLLIKNGRTRVYPHPAWASSYPHFLQSVTALRTVAANLRTEDLRSD